MFLNWIPSFTVLSALKNLLHKGSEKQLTVRQISHL